MTYTYITESNVYVKILTILILTKKKKTNKRNKKKKKGQILKVNITIKRLGVYPLYNSSPRTNQ